jgi:hypothetical protein
MRRDWAADVLGITRGVRRWLTHSLLPMQSDACMFHLDATLLEGVVGQLTLVDQSTLRHGSQFWANDVANRF